MIKIQFNKKEYEFLTNNGRLDAKMLATLKENVVADGRGIPPIEFDEDLLAEMVDILADQLAHEGYETNSDICDIINSIITKITTHDDW